MSLPFPESILVTGGAGFVGSSLAFHLKGRHPRTRVVCLDNLYRRGSELNVPRFQEAGVEFVKGDIRFAKEFPPGPFEFILECSAEPSVLAGYGESPDYLMETNFLGTYRCLEQARRWKCKFLFFSTSRVYPLQILEQHPWVEQPTRFAWTDAPGAAISPRGVREDCPMTGSRSLYGLTKFASEGLIEEYRSGFGLCAAINRCSVIAGPWQMGKVDQGVVALWVLRHFFRRPLKYIGYGGTGKQVRDVLHVADLCELVEEQISSFDRWDGWLGNVGGGLEISVSLQELTAVCRKIVGCEMPVGSEPENRRADLRIFLADCSRLFARTNWRPRRGVTQIVTDIFEWVRAHEKALQPLV
jgi:CDP-paratose 2-epimerase